MKNARLFRENSPLMLVSAEEIKNGLYSKNEEFVDPEYEFKVRYVKGAKNNGAPYFRLYYSYEEYKKLYPERADRYAIVANMRKYQESVWHRKWKDYFSSFCDIEKHIKNSLTNKWKFADAFFDETKTCIEFQHSYISFDFEERSKFYKDLSLKAIWLYDLSKANTRLNDDGSIDILEDNARGFFRISEKAGNLSENLIYIQVKSTKIYRVNELNRRESSNLNKSTIRFFTPKEKYTEEEFINAIKTNAIGKTPNNPQPLWKLWNKDYSYMLVQNTENYDCIFINAGREGDMFRDLNTGCIKYKYHSGRNQPNQKEYPLSHQKENSPIWILIKAKTK